MTASLNTKNIRPRCDNAHSRVIQRVDIVTYFEDLGICKEVVRAMNDMGWSEPTPVQEAAIPVGLSGSDLFAQAQTGTGKTGTYGSIILGKPETRSKDVSVLVLTPTRELALQVFEELVKLSKYTKHRCLAIYGGVGMTPQISALHKGVDIVVGTPGRLKDLLNRGDLDLSKLTTVVFDEADRMLDMGFSKDIDYILNKAPRQRHTMLFSATMSPEIKKLAVKQMNNPKELLVSKDELVLDLTAQYYLMADKDSKRNALYTILEKDNPKTIVFCHTKRKVHQVAKKMTTDGYCVGEIHGDVAQNKREKVVKSFKAGSINVLVATDVAARGLDIDDVDCVVNYDMPDEPETYVHRIGRTGRAGKEGMAVTFVIPNDRGESGMLKRIERVIDKEIEPLDIKIITRMDDLKRPKAVPKVVKSTENTNNNNNKKSKKPKKAPMIQIEINLGNADKVGKAEICKFVMQNAGLSNVEIGTIIMGENISLLDIEATKVEATCQALTQKKYGTKVVKASLI